MLRRCELIAPPLAWMLACPGMTPLEGWCMLE
jgi:hypothetical protein